jgi:hypothetical protein
VGARCCGSRRYGRICMAIFHEFAFQRLLYASFFRRLRCTSFSVDSELMNREAPHCRLLLLLCAGEEIFYAKGGDEDAAWYSQVSMARRGTPTASGHTVWCHRNTTATFSENPLIAIKRGDERGTAPDTGMSGPSADIGFSFLSQTLFFSMQIPRFGLAIHPTSDTQFAGTCAQKGDSS